MTRCQTVSMTPLLKPAHKSPMLGPVIFENHEKAKSLLDNELAFMTSNSILDAEDGDLNDEFEASLVSKSELKFDMMKIEDMAVHREDQEVRDRLRSIENFN